MTAEEFEQIERDIAAMDAAIPVMRFSVLNGTDEQREHVETFARVVEFARECAIGIRIKNEDREN